MPMLDQPATKYRAFAPVHLPDRRWPEQVISSRRVAAGVAQGMSAQGVGWAGG